MSDIKELELEADVWSDWLLYGRHGRDPDYEPTMRAAVADIRDRVLDGARRGLRLCIVGRLCGVSQRVTSAFANTMALA